MFCTDIDIKNLEYKSPTSNRSGGKVVHVSTVKGSSDYQHRIRFQMSESDKENLQTAIWGGELVICNMPWTWACMMVTVRVANSGRSSSY